MRRLPGIRERPAGRVLILFVVAAMVMVNMRMPSIGGIGPPPDRIPDWFDHDSSTNGMYVRNALRVSFKPTASRWERARAIAAVHGTVVGGSPLKTQEGEYFLRVPAHGNDAHLQALADSLNAQPGVDIAARIILSKPN